MMDILLVVSVMLLLATMVMLIMVLHTLSTKLDDQETKIEYWRDKALNHNAQELESRMRAGLWLD